jgi:L-alanine-DL-glutamate epimerase-like enolase superfamily enzyme
LVRLEDDAGNVGWGEAAPLQGYSGGTVEEVCEALAGWSGELDQVKVPEARAALDLAFWDLEGRRRGEPVWKLLGGGSAQGVVLNATIFGGNVAVEAERARAAGFRCLKIKVGLEGDLERLRAVRAAVGPAAAIRVDANGAWSVEQAVAALREFEPVGIELCEEPVHGLSEIARVASVVHVPVSLDESAGLVGALDERVCDAVCLKLARCGGITGLVAACERARAAGYRVYLASTLDGPLGIAAALHAAAAVRPDLPCGLATMSGFERYHPLAALGGVAAPPLGPGLGDGLVDWYSRG